MKRILVPENHMAIVMKNAKIHRFLIEGKHWLTWGETADVYDMSKDFYVQQDVDILLNNESFWAYVDVVEVPDGNVGMLYINKVLLRMLGVGRHIFWKGVKPYEFRIEDISSIEIPQDISLNVLEKPVISSYVRSYKLEPNEKGILYVNGKYFRILGAGTYYWWRNPVTVAVTKVDMRQTILELSGQEILTKDKAQIRINFSVQYQVTDIEKALLENKDYEKQLHNIMQLALRGFIGQITLDELMENKAQVNKYVMTVSQEQAQHLGITVLNCGLKDIILPGEMKEIMNQVLIAEKKAQANIIMRREETASTRSLLNTAKLMEENAMLMRLKEMEYIEKIADKINSISISGNGQIIDQLKQMFVK
jgi:regulator of protease activity HflC (stomatin/prohibitin superfamily)